MTLNDSLKGKCRICRHDDEDRFVGLKGDTNAVQVSFPLGYELSETEDDIRRDILQLFRILSEFKKEEEGYISKRKYDETFTGMFPLNAYLEIILYYMENGYYKEVEPVYKTRQTGKINWSRTIKQQKPLLYLNKDNVTYSPIYTNFTVKLSTLNEDKEITLINQYCVRESFEKVGWIFTSFIPPKSEIPFDKNRFLSVLRTKLSNTNNDVKKRLFRSMIDIIKDKDEKNPNERVHFGTNSFAYVWEGLIEKTFGNVAKEDYYPRGEWTLKYNDDKPTHELRPDTIMCYDGNFFVLDAKYYRYGDSNDPSHLPSSSSINKQITYGEYVKLKENDKTVYNAFLMPYNKNKDIFPSKEDFLNIGEAIPKWKYLNGEDDEIIEYEHIQGILVDINFLMDNYRSQSTENIENLAKAIMDAFEEKD